MKTFLHLNQKLEKLTPTDKKHNKQTISQK